MAAGALSVAILLAIIFSPYKTLLYTDVRPLYFATQETILKKKK